MLNMSIILKKQTETRNEKAGSSHRFATTESKVKTIHYSSDKTTPPHDEQMQLRQRSHSIYGPHSTPATAASAQ